MTKRAANLILPPVGYLRARLSYDPETGALRWKARPKDQFATASDWATHWLAKSAEDRAESLQESTGYYRVWLNGHYYRAHRVIWKLMTGDEPPETIDHVDGDRLNNRWANLRAATQAEQMQFWKEARGVLRYG
jgi:hypothetical protein